MTYHLSRLVARWGPSCPGFNFNHQTIKKIKFMFSVRNKTKFTVQVISNLKPPVLPENILNQKRNFRKIGLRGGHTRYERKKNRHLPQMKLKYQMKLMIFRLYMNFDELIFNHCAITNTNKNC